MFGPNGNFPARRENGDELTFGVAVDEEQRVVVLHFDQSIRWLAMKPELAMRLAGCLVEGAQKLGRDVT